MGKEDKLVRKLQSDSTITWNELESLLNRLGWKTLEGRGSRVKFVKTIEGAKQLITLHRPHPGNKVKVYAQKIVIEKLEEVGDIK